MNDIAHTLYNIVQYILGFGPTVMLPLVLFILALFFKVKPAKALRSSGNDSNLLIVFYVQIMPDDFVMQLHRF